MQGFWELESKHLLEKKGWILNGLVGVNRNDESLISFISIPFFLLYAEK